MVFCWRARCVLFLRKELESGKRKTMMQKLLFLLFVPGLVSIRAESPRPNILFAFADDWGRYASKYAEVEGPGTPCDLIKTPNFDRVASEGVLFRNAHVTAPSCTPCRSSLLSGQYFYRTGRGAILSGAVWDPSIPTYPLLLKDSGYHIGFTYKVWSPGTPADAGYGGRAHAYTQAGSSFNGFSQSVTKAVAAGKSVEAAKAELLKQVSGNFEAFLEKRAPGQPFCYWFGPTNTHRMWTAGSGKALWGLNPDELKGKLPAFLPDVPEVREDFADYLGEAMAFDSALGVLLAQLEKIGELDNTLVVVSGDHGAPGFPRGKCNLYDFGTGVSLAVRWGQARPGRVVNDFVNLMDLAPTFLEAGKVAIPAVMTGRSFLSLLTSDQSGWIDPSRSWLITGRERHVGNAREGGLPYPQRALRNKDFLYIHNFEPDRWPMGDPGFTADKDRPSHAALVNTTHACFPDMDASPTKAWMVENAYRAEYKTLFDLGFGKRPREELYATATDPDQIHNLADDSRFAEVKLAMHDQLMAELTRTGDPRVTGDRMTFERPPFTGPLPPPPRPKP